MRLRIPAFALLSVLVAWAASAQTAAPWQTGTYVYDGAGNIKSIGTIEQYRYDGLGRIISGTVGPAQTQTALYDSYGNILTLTTNGTQLTFGVDAQTNRLTSATANVFATYDNAGRLVTLPATNDSFLHDAGDMIIRSTVSNATKVHIYTPSDERLASLVPGSTEQSEWTLRDTGGRVLRRIERNGSQWTWKQDYIYAGSTLLASEVDTSQQTLHYFTDHLGSPRLITGNGGMKVSAHTYYPFGVEATPGGQDPEKLKFTGHERDHPTLDYMHARYYKPNYGRFLSVDPVLQMKRAMKKPQMWNRYAYAANNPLKYVDPTGKVLELTGNDEERKKTLAALRNSVPVEMRMFVRTTTTKDGKTVLDARYLNMGRESSSGNFQALRTISNSPGLVAANTSSTSATFRNGDTVPLTRGGVAGLTIESPANVERGTTSVLVAGNLPAQETSNTLAHELRHAMLYLLGKPFTHEPGFHETSPRVFSMWDPNGPVNRSTAAAEAEADRNFDPFYRHDQ